MNWIELIREAYNHRVGLGPKSTPVFHPPALSQEIDECERRLGVIFPAELRELLSQTDGVTERLSTVRGEIDVGSFLFSTEKMLEINTFQRTQTGDYTMPLDCLLFVAEDGIGDYFGFAVVKRRVPHSRIYFWNHEDDSRLSIAPSLSYFIENWLNGTIKV